MKCTLRKGVAGGGIVGWRIEAVNIKEPRFYFTQFFVSFDDAWKHLFAHADFDSDWKAMFGLEVTA